MTDGNTSVYDSIVPRETVPWVIDKSTLINPVIVWVYPSLGSIYINIFVGFNVGSTLQQTLTVSVSSSLKILIISKSFNVL
mgnify:CR=1 FL=1